MISATTEEEVDFRDSVHRAHMEAQKEKPIRKMFESEISNNEFRHSKVSVKHVNV